MADESVEFESPRLIEVGVSVSTGGKMQLKKYEVSADYHLSMSGKWAMPEGMTDDQAADFRYEQYQRIRKELEPLAQQEIDDLVQQKTELE